MALYKIEDGTSSVDMNPTRGWMIPETRIREHTETKEGPTDTHEWGNAEKHEVPLINLTKARADKLLEWWEDMVELTITPPVGSPFQAIIDGIERPLNMWHHEFDTKYAGMLRLCEVSSQSFSSSFVSVSKSASCSSFDASQSEFLSASKSCSGFLTFVSHSSSQGIDIVEDASRSSSISRSCSESLSESDSISYSTSRSCSDALSTSLFSSYIGGGYSYLSSVSQFSSCEDLSSRDNDPALLSVSSCEDLSSVSGSDSRSSSLGVIVLSFTSQSCSLDPSETSQSESAAGTSCSLSAGGIS